MVPEFVDRHDPAVYDAFGDGSTNLLTVDNLASLNAANGDYGASSLGGYNAVVPYQSAEDQWR